MARARSSSRGNTRVEPGSSDGFWDRPPLMNLLADLLLLAGGVLLTWSAVVALQRLPVFPLKQLVVATPPANVSPAQIEYTARTAVSGNFFTVNLEAAQAAFERLPWVRSASLRRIWPDGVELQLEEHQAVARWTPLEGEGRLVSSKGEVFAATSADRLPQFSGPEGSAPRVLARYQEFTDSLARIKRVPVAVHFSAREAWDLKLDDGLVLELGRDQPKHPLMDRLNRFAAHYASVAAGARTRLQTVGAVDMRYPNGFALRGLAASSMEGKPRTPPSSTHPRAGVTDQILRLAGGAGEDSPGAAARSNSRSAAQSAAREDGSGCRQCQARAANARAEAA